MRMRAAGASGGRPGRSSRSGLAVLHKFGCIAQMLVSVAAVVAVEVAWPTAGMPFFVDAGSRGVTRRLQFAFL